MKLKNIENLKKANVRVSSGGEERRIESYGGENIEWRRISGEMA